MGQIMVCLLRELVFQEVDSPLQKNNKSKTKYRFNGSCWTSIECTNTITLWNFSFTHEVFWWSKTLKRLTTICARPKWCLTVHVPRDYPHELIALNYYKLFSSGKNQKGNVITMYVLQGFSLEISEHAKRTFRNLTFPRFHGKNVLKLVWTRSPWIWSREILNSFDDYIEHLQDMNCLRKRVEDFNIELLENS